MSGPVVACVKVGDRYDDQYVTNLRDGVQRHVVHDHMFVCFTDREVSGVTCLPLPAKLPGWWAKLGLFKLGYPLVYFDLDVVITGDLTPLIEWSGFGIIKDWSLPGFNSSVMKLTGNERHVWNAFEPGAMTSFPFGDQQWITQCMPEAATFPPEWFPSFKFNRCAWAVPKNALAVIFHGQPKPADCGGWVTERWAARPV